MIERSEINSKQAANDGECPKEVILAQIAELESQVLHHGRFNTWEVTDRPTNEQEKDEVSRRAT